MVRKKAPSKKRSKPVGKPPSASASGRLGILLEDIQSKFDFLAEGQATLRSETHQIINDFRQSMTTRFEVLENVVRQNSVDIRKNSEDIRKNSEDIAVLSNRVEDLAVALTTKVDQSEIQRLDARIDAVS
jgi:hypothetical protein